MPLKIREHRLPWYNFNNQSTATRRRPFEGDCVAGQPGRLAALGPLMTLSAVPLQR
jgi:hypothetical protein